jgi:hypothetical protein
MTGNQMSRPVAALTDINEHKNTYDINIKYAKILGKTQVRDKYKMKKCRQQLY